MFKLSFCVFLGIAMGILCRCLRQRMNVVRILWGFFVWFRGKYQIFFRWNSSKSEEQKKVLSSFSANLFNFKFSKLMTGAFCLVVIQVFCTEMKSIPIICCYVVAAVIFGLIFFKSYTWKERNKKIGFINKFLSIHVNAINFKCLQMIAFNVCMCHCVSIMFLILKWALVIFAIQTRQPTDSLLKMLKLLWIFEIMNTQCVLHTLVT